MNSYKFEIHFFFGPVNVNNKKIKIRMQLESGDDSIVLRACCKSTVKNGWIYFAVKFSHQFSPTFTHVFNLKKSSYFTCQGLFCCQPATTKVNFDIISKGSLLICDLLERANLKNLKKVSCL